MAKPRSRWQTLDCLERITGVRGPLLMSTAHGNVETSEVAFLSGMPRETPQEEEAAWLVKFKFWLDGRLHELMENRNPDPDAPLNRDDLERMIRESARIGAIYGAQNGGYSEAPKPDSNTNKIVVGVGIVVISAIVIGAYTLSAQMSAFHEWQVATEKRLDHLEAQRP